MERDKAWGTGKDTGRDMAMGTERDMVMDTGRGKEKDTGRDMVMDTERGREKDTGRDMVMDTEMGIPRRDIRRMRPFFLLSE